MWHLRAALKSMMVGTPGAVPPSAVLIEQQHASKKRHFGDRLCAVCCAPRALLVLLIAATVMLAVHLGRMQLDEAEADDDPATALVRRAYIRERPWPPGMPRWCAQLLRKPRERPRTSAVYDCRRGRFGAVCEDGTPAFFSQYNQDIWTFQQHWRHLKRPGIYVDIAANEPVRISNTFFFDRCLGWSGLCIEPHPEYKPLLVDHRSCGVLPLCVGDRLVNVTFALDAGSSGVLNTNKNLKARTVGKRIKVPCVPTRSALNVARLRTVDMLSLDVEGHEERVLQGIDWTTTRINVIIIETLSNRSRTLLKSLGYKSVKQPRTNAEKAKPGALISDFVFIHPSVEWGKPV